MMPFLSQHGIIALLAVTLVYPVSTSSTTCMMDWLKAAGVPDAKVAFYEGKLCEGRVEIDTIAHLTPFFFRLLGMASAEHQRLILECARKKCHNPCSNGGLCSASGGAYLCKCRTGFTGNRCEVDRYCDPNPCVHRGKKSGTCQHDVTTGYTCTCLPGYEGRKCHQPKDHCRSDPCLHGGTCKRLFDDFRCACRMHYHGKTCQRKWISQSDYETVKTKLALTLKLFGWKHRGSCLYRAFKDKKTFQGAEKSCVLLNGHLASVHSQDEMEFICDQVVSEIANVHVWLGGTDRKVEGEWKWTDGSKWDYTRWSFGEPSNYLHSNGNDEDSLELVLPRRQDGSIARIYWNDMESSGLRKRTGYVCKVCN